LRFLLAQVLVKKEDFAQADRILQSLRNAPLDAALSDAVRTLSNFVERTTEKEDTDREAAEARARRDDEAARAANEAARAAAAAAAAQPAVPEPVAAEPTPPPASERKNELVPLTPQRVMPEGPRVTGLLTLIDCTNGVTLTVKTPTEAVKFHTARPDTIEFFSHVPNVGTEIRCGPTPGSGIPVIVTYRPTPGGAGLGEPILVEFVEK
jgi:hypothetical protein